MGVEIAALALLGIEQQKQQDKLLKAQRDEARKAQLLNAPKPVTETAKLTSGAAQTRKKTTIEDLFIQPTQKARTGLSSGGALQSALGVG